MEGGLGSDLTVLVVSLAIIPAVLAFLLLCLKIRFSSSNQEIYGVEGTVTNKNDESLNISGSTDKHNLSADKHHLSIDEANIRTPSYDRKLPEIPDDVYKTSIKEDNSSELYATVDDNIAETLSPQGAAAVSVDPSNHPYAKVKKQRKQEHPYAKVGDSQNGKRQLEDEDDETEYETTEKLDPNTTTSSGGAGGGEAAAASASAAGFSGWMPPPPRNPSRQATPLPPEPPVQQPVQQHFSGDSQDSTYSTKGYTSISVREPLENLRAAVPPSQPTIQEGNYVTLSETSDEMYAAIDDNVYMDPQGAHGGPSREKESVGEEEDLTTMYSKIDKTKKRNERRTASYDGGYATVNKSRPSPERNLGERLKKRFSAVAFSSRTEEVDYSGYEVARVDNWKPRATGEKRKVDPGYETVPFDAQPPPPHIPQQAPFHRDLNAFPRHTFSGRQDPGYEVLPGDSKVSDARDPDYETVPSESQSREPGYETLPHRFRSDSFDPGYETLSKRSESTGPRSYPEYNSTRYREYREPGYETVQDVRTKDPDYESVLNNQGGNPVSDPGYETVPERRLQNQPMTTTANDKSRYYASAAEESGAVSRPSKPRAAPAFKSPSLSPQLPPSGGGSGGPTLNHIYRSSEPELTNTDPEETTIGYESLRNDPGHKFSMDSEEGYETIPAAADPFQHRVMNQSQRVIANQLERRDSTQSQTRTSSSLQQSEQLFMSNKIERRDSHSSSASQQFHLTRGVPLLERRNSNHLEGRNSNQFERQNSSQLERKSSNLLERRSSNQSQRGAEHHHLEGKDSNHYHRRNQGPVESKSARARETEQSPPSAKVRRDPTPHSRVVNQQAAAGKDSEYEIVGNLDGSPATVSLVGGGRDLSFTDGGSLKIRQNSEEINFIDEDIDSGPGTPGSPTIHMSVVDNTEGVRRASVVVIERLEDSSEILDTSADEHVFV